MKYLYYLIIAFLVCSFTSNAQNAAYAVSLIPDSLKDKVDAVYRTKNEVFTVHSIDWATYTVKQAITLLSNKAEAHATFYKFTNKFYKLNECEIKVFNADGKQIEKFKKKDLQKVASGEGLVDDGYVYYLTVSVAQYPITIEQHYEVEFYGTLNYPSIELGYQDESIQSAKFTMQVVKENDLRYFLKNSKLAPLKKEDGNKLVYEWEVNNVKAIKGVKAKGNAKPSPVVLTAPSKFKMDDFDGDMTTWNSFGYWYGKMSTDALALDDKAKSFFYTLTSSCSTEKEKIKKIYNYIQTNFRYVSIQLGIGGFKPFSATFTDNKKYGDCKALSNFMQASLACINIKSYQALINAGYNEEPIEKNFPSNQFNHVIVCVPLPNDTVWLECTSKTNEFGVLGNFTENKYALLITEEGGKLVSTPKSFAKNNVLSTNNKVVVNADGSATLHCNYNATGEFKQELQQYFTNSNRDLQRKILTNYLGYKAPDDFTIYTKEGEDSLQIIYEKIHDFNAGKKYFIASRQHKHWLEILPTELTAEEHYFEYPFIKNDTTIYNLPAGSSIETWPKNTTFGNDLASFKSSYVYNKDANTITVISSLQLNKHKASALEYIVFKSFFDKVLDEQKEKFVLLFP